MKNIKVQLYAQKYSDGDVVQAILDKQLGFELTISSETEVSRRIFSLDEIKTLKFGIEEALKEYERALKLL